MTKLSMNKVLLSGIAGVGFMLAAGSAQALDWKVGDVDVVLDTTVSLGVGGRVSGADCQYAALANGGCTTTNNTVNAAGGGSGVSFGVNDDDGQANHDQWDLYSAAAKVTSDLELSWQNYGAFLRGTAFYDYWQGNKVGNTQSGSRFGPSLNANRNLSDAYRGHSAQNRARRSIDLLDAFVYGNFDVAGNPLTVRLGKQVTNWGESLLILGGINPYLPVDVSKLRTPGAELKDALLPEPSLYVSLGLPANFSVEGFYTFDWVRTKIDACGTFFSGTDAACEGGKYVMNGVEFDQAFVSAGGVGGLLATTPIGAGAGAVAAAIGGGAFVGGLAIERAPSDEPRDQGQFGFAVRHYADWLNDGTELGLYFTKYHSKLPIGTFTAGGNGAGASARAVCGALGAATFGACATTALFAGGPSLLEAALLAGAANKQFLTQYPSDISTIGASFSTSIDGLLGGTAVAGEIAYTPNMPFGISDVEQNAQDLDNAFLPDFIAGVPDGTLARVTTNDVIAAGGGAIPGFRRTEVITGQVHTTSTLTSSEPVVDFIGSDIVILLANVGFQYLPDLSSDPNNRFGIPRSGGGHPSPFVDPILGSGAGHFRYADSLSWGYRLIAIAQYNNAFGSAWTVSPSMQWAHDVSGFSAGPIGPGFIEGKKTISIGATASYQNTWSVSTRYTNSFGASFYNFASDKDFVTFDVSYAF